MCGIIHVKRLDGKGASKMVLKRYRRQKSRGSEGFGFIAIEDGKIIEYERAEQEKNIVDFLQKQKATEVLFHHRFPTSTPNFKDSAHPIKVSHDSLKHDYYVVHNGIIYDDDELKTEHNKLGFKYTTELCKKWYSVSGVISSKKQWNDSEALAVELARALDNGKNSIDVTGSIAFICLQAEKNSRRVKRLFFGRNDGSPLKLLKEDCFITITSEGGGKSIEKNMLYAIDYDASEITQVPFTVGEDYLSKSYGFATGGFKWSADDDIPSLKLPTSEVLNDNDYYELSNEYQEIQQQLAKIDNEGEKGDEYITYLQERLLDIEDELKAYEKKELKTGF